MNEDITVTILPEATIRTIGEVSPPPRERHPYPDPTLAALLFLAQTKGLRGDVTLWIGGMLVTGTLSSYADFLRALADGFDLVPDGAGAEMAEVYRGMAIEGEEHVSTLDEEFTPQAVYLINSRTVIPGVGVVPTNRPIAWAGRVDAIDGWTLGTFSSD